MPRRARLYIGRWVMSLPSKATAPLSGVTMPRIIRNVVVLPGPVAAEQADDFLLRQDEADFVDDRAPVVSLAELGGFQKVHAVNAVARAERRGHLRASARKSRAPDHCGQPVENRTADAVKGL